MSYEDPIEAALRALTDVPWTKRKDRFETRANKTHTQGIVDTLTDHGIAATAEVSAARSGRYMITVMHDELPKILKVIEKRVSKPLRAAKNGTARNPNN